MRKSPVAASACRSALVEPTIRTSDVGAWDGSGGAHAIHIASNRVERISPSELLVNGRRLDIENLRRLVTQAPDRGQDIVDQYLSHLFENDPGSVTTLPWEIAKSMVMPRIHHNAIFDRLERELVAHIPFVNDTAVLFVIDLPHMTVSITTEQMIKWGIDSDTLDSDTLME